MGLGQGDVGNLLQLQFLLESIFCEVPHPSLCDPIAKLHHAKQVDSVSCILQVTENNSFRELYKTRFAKSLNIDNIATIIIRIQAEYEARF